MECNCWVATKSEEERFGIRYGAHALKCPAFRQSLDPVDAANDRELREHNWQCGCGKRIGISGIMCGECSRKITAAINA